MSENELNDRNNHADEARDNLVLTGEEIELPGEDSDASAIIGESSAPIHTGEIESVSIGALRARFTAAAPLKPAIEDKISTGELPVVSAPDADLGAVAPTEEVPGAEAVDEGGDNEASAVPAPTGEDTAREDVTVGQDAHGQDAHGQEGAGQDEDAQAALASWAREDAQVDETPAFIDMPESPGSSQDQIPFSSLDTSGAQESVSDPEPAPAFAPVMTPAQAAAALGSGQEQALDSGEEMPIPQTMAAEMVDAPGLDAAETSSEDVAQGEDAASADTPREVRSLVEELLDGVSAAEQAQIEASAALASTVDEPTPQGVAQESGDADQGQGDAFAEASFARTLPSRRSMIFGDEEALSPSIPPLTPAAQEERASSWMPDVAPPPAPFPDGEVPAAAPSSFAEESVPPAEQAGAQDAAVSYSFDDQDASEPAPSARHSLLTEEYNERDAATLAAIASAASGQQAPKAATPASLGDEIFSVAPPVSEMPSRTGAHCLSFLLFLVLTPLGWYLAADAAARMTMAESAPMYTGVASFLALGELLGAIVIAVILFLVARRSSLGAWIVGVLVFVAGLPWVMVPGVTASAALASLTALSETGSLGANLSHHLQASGYSGRLALLGVLLMGVAYLSHAARRTGRSEEALRVSIEATNPAGAFYSKRARKRAAKDAGLK